MIDPFAITDYNRDEASLQEVMLFWGCAAGKNGSATAKALDRFLRKANPEGRLPFEAILAIPVESLPSMLREAGLGCYNHRARMMRELASSGLDLRTCSSEELEAIHGIGMKTSRCFILHSRKGARVAGLDVHIKEYLRSLGHKVPLSLSRSTYLFFERLFLERADSLGMTPAELDLSVWSDYASRRRPAQEPVLRKL